MIDLEVLADQLAQQIVRRFDRLILEQPVGLLDGRQCPLGVLRHPGQHPLTLSLLPPRASGFSPGWRSRTQAVTSRSPHHSRPP